MACYNENININGLKLASSLKNMTKKIFNKWIKVLEGAENKNKHLLKNGKITKDIYILLNKINADKYEQIVEQWHHELV